MENVFTTMSSELNLDVSVLLMELLFAAVVGIVLAFHPTRFKTLLKKKKTLDVAKAQILLCIAGALLINVIGDSAARAFGIFGIGSFVRFRAPVRSPMEAAIMFLLLGLGMAVGLKLYAVAAVSTLFLFVILFPVSWVKANKSKEEVVTDEK
jgi:hypothetical protein